MVEAIIIIMLRRLNDNQYTNRVRQVAALLGDMVTDQAWQMLEDAGVLTRLRDAGSLPGGTNAPQAPRDGTSVAELLEQAYRRGLERADPQMVRALEDKRARREAIQQFQVHIELTPYRVADHSLRKIVLEADEKAVREIMDGFAERSEIDGCPKQLVSAILDVLGEWMEWARSGLQPHGKTEADDAPD